MPLLRPLCGVVVLFVSVLLFTSEFLLEDSVDLPELTAPLLELDLLAALAGRSFLPEFLLTSGR